ncbi:MAG: hypothetical protein WBB01_26575 [Phormidesmis sp.]
MTRITAEALSVSADPVLSARAVADKLSQERAKSIASPHQNLSDKTTLYPSRHPAGARDLSAAVSRMLTPISRFPLETLPRQMRVSGLNHFNITAAPPLIEQVKQFYVDIIGLTVGPRAHLDHDGYWLYAGEVPILHLSARRNIEQVALSQKGYFNHISLSCVGLQAAIAKMTATQTPYQLIYLSDIHQTQLFLKDPADIGVELTFFDECL